MARVPPCVFVSFSAGIGLLLISQPRQIVHAGIQRQGHAAALLKAEIPLAPLDFGIGALVDAGQHLHFDLGISPLFPEFPQSAHNNHRIYYGKLSYCN